MEEPRAPLIVFANFFSDVAVSLRAHHAPAHWARQAPRKIWLMRPGDVLLTPVPLGRDFTRYACGLLGIPHRSITVLTVPSSAGVPMAEALDREGLTDVVRALIAHRPGAQLLPLALDSPTVAFADRLGVPVAPYGPGGVPPSAPAAVYRLNTKSGFRDLAGEMGMRTPPGRGCGDGDLVETISTMLEGYGRIVVKPDRSAGGHGLRFISGADAGWARAVPPPGAAGRGGWVVEEWLAEARSVSVQMEALPSGPHLLFTGEMRTVAGSYTGYVSPLDHATDMATRELEHWGAMLGRHLSAHGYCGPYGIDALLASDGTLYATESNVRRTATTTPQAMVDRLSSDAGFDSPAWLLAEGRSRLTHTFADALRLLQAKDLAWSPSRGEGVVLYADAPDDERSWLYAVIAADVGGTARLHSALADVMEFEGE
ncbi:peptide ligase PGM1-related protein [Streptomyces sp. NBC_01353]|uniref:preATP grasp domain-containing protein n=1 Tax=Streptomyces sp. NBC_01353 TaxID=2903835 RepID=UPI002E341634|nr:peptide ligase PGM1-related protein [Streptomyces sp. NBC_01353]